MTTTDIKLQICLGMVPGTTTYTIRLSWRSATERLGSTYVPTHKTPSITSGTTPHPVLVVFQIAEIETPRYRLLTLCILVCSTEHFRKPSRKLVNFWLRMRYGVHTSYP